MASTTQSALEYVRGARTHLVKTLKNLSVILENLKQQGVLRDEEVSRIQAEGNDYDKNRNLLDSVTKKGEAASYEFLKIIDITRKRTHGRTSLLPEKQMFDLHHWISCFPFKEDTQVGNNYLQAPTPCHRYQAKLKSKAQKISKEFWTANKDLFEENSKPDLSYMSLVLDTQGSVSPSKIKKCKNKKSRMSRCKKLGTYIPKDKADSSPSDLLKTDKNILLVGKSGIGKTALTHEMLKLWTEKDDKELNYMFYFDMRKISNIKSLEDLLFNEFSEPDEGNDEVLQDIKNNSDNVTLIFDGITDLSLPVVQKLVKKDLLKDSKVVVTCRPADEDHLLSEDFLRVEVKGFSEQTIKTFISRMLRERKERVLSNLELFTLCHVPMYALMVAACFTFETSEDFQKPCCITDIYINIFRFCLERNSNTKYIHLDAFIESKSQEILSLAEVAFRATEGKTVNLTLRPFRDSCVLSLLKQLVIKVAPTERITTYAFLHYTMQEFFAALWLLKNPDLISNVFQQCLTEEKKHMKHLIPYMCRLLTEKSPSLMEYLIPAEELKNTSNWFFKKVISTFLPSLCGNDDPDTEDSGRILFLCQCLYESQCPEACIDLLEQLDFHLDLSEESLDPYPCCAVAYVITQSKERKIWLNLEDVTMSQQGMRPLLGCLPNVQWCDSLPLQLWEIFLLSEGEMDYITLLGLDGNQLHLPVEGGRKLFERAVTVLQKISKKVKICLHWEREKPDCHSLCETLLEALPYVSSLSFRRTYRGPGLQDQERCYETLKRQEKQLFLDLCLRAANHIQGESVHNEVNDLISLFSFNTDVHNILLDFYQHVKTQESSVVIEKLKPFFQSAPAVWIIDLSERKSSILLEVLRLQPEKKQVELRGCSEEESEVRTLLQCLPHISQLSFCFDFSRGVKFFGTLFCAAAEREQQTGEKTLQLLSSVCTYPSFPLTHIDDEDDEEFQCDFLLDLASHLKDYETKSGLSVLPSLQSVLQSAPAVWIIDLSKRKSSILLEVLRLQPEKKQVKLIDCSEEESEVRTLLQCLPHISQLSCGPEFFQRVCAFISVRSREETEQSAALLRMPGITLLLSGELLRETCLSVGRVLQLCGANVDLILKPRKMSDKEAFALFRRTTQLHSLKLSNDMALLLGGWVRRWGVGCQVTVEELSLCPQTAQPSHRVLLKVVSSLASLLRYWAVRQLDLTEVCVPALGLTPLLLHDGPLNIKLSEKNVQQLLSLLHELQDQDLTWSFLSKFGGDLTSFSLNWELLHLLLQHPSAQTLTVNMRKNLFLQENITRLLPYLDRIVFKRPSPSFVLTAIREIYKARASFIIPSLLRSLGHVINLTCREMSPMDCVALLYTLAHSDGVKLNLLWTSIPPWKIESILLNLDKVSQLSVDRNLLLRLVHGCTASGAQQGAAESLLRTVQHRLDLSCSSCVELPEEDQSDTLRLTAEDCRAVSTILRRSRRDTQLILQECEFQDSGLDLLFPVLHKVQLRASKAVLLQLVSLVPVNSEWDTVGRAVSLCKALEGELDLSHSSLDQRACAALALILDSSEELTELDLSHCQLTDQLLLTLSAQLHKVQVLDLSHNNITDASTDLLLQLVSINPSIHTVRVPSAPFPVRPTPVPVPPGVRHLQLPVLPIPVLLLRRSS
ncbi:uncharacterized protein LOC117549781 isoform X3 [Gymnodraco acuticeps]|uniref:Uncharacterized protein LOC117549781 isoform X3 n=1 Tax=Gymnodraco acuticeps TaxID=8218 RepID=A0A6P8VN29_GYMAC|nr:uncharacterized protein LOC117549781 isoform X3 [Gymnodraco acuticeps]